MKVEINGKTVDFNIPMTLGDQERMEREIDQTLSPVAKSVQVLALLARRSNAAVTDDDIRSLPLKEVNRISLFIKKLDGEVEDPN
jgi:5-enolpyruvylshikimate-3-phosphate synthase